ncbi:helix-turn-helix domain-containing protein [bacterium]|nr:helix-turn-helix domain-containing protein [bacterium]
MRSTDFEHTLGDLATSLGDPTRRGIFVSVRESADPLSAGHISKSFDIHPNVARHHLDHLVESGYLRVSRRAVPSGTAGRPAKHYEATNKEILVSYPARRYDLLAELLVRVVERIAPDDGPAIAEEIGREYGRTLAAEIGTPAEPESAAALSSVARAMMGVGFEMAPDEGDRFLLTSHCPFGTAATNHPEVVCRLDQGIVRGLLSEIGTDESRSATVTPHADPEVACITEVDPST